MSLSLTVLGSSGMYATTERAASGYLLEVNGKNLWMDAGSGTWRNLLAYIDYEDVDGIILTHRHPDHTTDVFQAFHARQYGCIDPLPPIPLWAPEETIMRIRSFSLELPTAFDLHVVSEGDVVEFAGARLSFVSMAHPPETVGVRVDYNGSVVAYSSDTGAGADFSKLAGGADVFICEATLQNSDDRWEGHLRASEAGDIASSVEVGKLVLTHLPPGRDHGLSLTEAEQTAAETQVQLASDGLRLDF